MTQPSDRDLAAGFIVIHGNQSETLRDLLCDWMRAHPLAPLENEVILVQSNGIAQWLTLSLASDPAPGTETGRQTGWMMPGRGRRVRRRLEFIRVVRPWSRAGYRGRAGHPASLALHLAGVPGRAGR